MYTNYGILLIIVSIILLLAMVGAIVITKPSEEKQPTLSFVFSNILLAKSTRSNPQNPTKPNDESTKAKSRLDKEKAIEASICRHKKAISDLEKQQKNFKLNKISFKQLIEQKKQTPLALLSLKIRESL